MEMYTSEMRLSCVLKCSAPRPWLAGPLLNPTKANAPMLLDLRCLPPISRPSFSELLCFMCLRRSVVDLKSGTELKRFLRTAMVSSKLGLWLLRGAVACSGWVSGSVGRMIAL